MIHSDHQIRFATPDQLQDCLFRMGEVQCEMPGLSEQDHGLQCADVLRVAAPEDLPLQISGLVHDVGAAFGDDRDHGRIGALAVRGLLGERVSELVRLHVDAKRYLVASDPAYRARLSPVSLHTLQMQGGGMDAAECAAFATNPFHKDAIRLREADDRAKTPGKATFGLTYWIGALRQLADANR